ILGPPPGHVPRRRHGKGPEALQVRRPARRGGEGLQLHPPPGERRPRRGGGEFGPPRLPDRQGDPPVPRGHRNHHPPPPAPPRAPAPDGRYFVAGASDQTIHVWAPDRAEPVLSIFVAGREWIAWTPEGYYDCSTNGERLIGWQVNGGRAKAPALHPASRFRAS